MREDQSRIQKNQQRERQSKKEYQPKTRRRTKQSDQSKKRAINIPYQTKTNTQTKLQNEIRAAAKQHPKSNFE